MIWNVGRVVGGLGRNGTCYVVGKGGGGWGAAVMCWCFRRASFVEVVVVGVVAVVGVVVGDEVELCWRII